MMKRVSHITGLIRPIDNDHGKDECADKNDNNNKNDTQGNTNDNTILMALLPTNDNS
jgi:hypothetical protein